jgi:lipopolysaccharide transport system ATP-binding protein
VGDVAFQHKCLDSIQHFRRRGGTLVFVSHDLASIQSLCNNAIWLEHGEVQARGAPLDVSMSYVSHVADEAEAKAEAKAAAAGALEADDPRRWGSGQVRITSVSLRDGAGHERKVFTTGEPLEIHLGYTVHPGAQKPVFGLAIHHQNGVHVCGPNTQFEGLQIPATPGQGSLIYRIPTLPLLEGGYDISVAAVNGGDNETYDYHDRLYPFRVSPGRGYERYGVVTLNGVWSVEEPAREEAVRPVEVQLR